MNLMRFTSASACNPESVSIGVTDRLYSKEMVAPPVHTQAASIRTSLIPTVIFALLASGNLMGAEIIPSARLANWTPGIAVGVPGGIPTNRTRLIDVTQAPYGADPTGTADTTPAIQAAVNAATQGDVVYLPPGTYRLNGTINIFAPKKNITVRGAGRATVLDARATTAFNIGSGTDYAWAQQAYAEPKSNNTVTAGLLKGSTELTIADTSAFTVGQMIQIALENQMDDAAIASGAVPVISTGGFGTLRRQMSRITGKTATKLTIFPPLHFTPDAGLTAKVNHLREQVEGIGLESFSVDCTNGSASAVIWLNQCYASWVKNVRVANTTNYGFYYSDSLNCELRGSTVAKRKTGGSNGAGLLIGHVGNSLFEDNTLYGVMPPIEVNFSSTGNVVAYNFLYNEVGGNLNVNHGPHNSFNLYEGNITPNIQSDGYFGGSSDDTFFRNWITGASVETGAYTFIIGLNRFTRNYSFVGNILGSAGWPYGPTGYSFGNPYMGNGASLGTAQPTTGDFWTTWKTTGTLTTRTSDTAGTISVSGGSVASDANVNYPHYMTLRVVGSRDNAIAIQAVSQTGNIITFKNSGTLPAVGTTFEVWWGAQGYSEADLDVQRSAILKANFHAWSAGGLAIPGTEVIAPEALPNSLYRSTKPDWFGALKWPPFDPFSPTPAYDSIPAGYRYLNDGADLPLGSNSAPTTVRIFRG